MREVERVSTYWGMWDAPLKIYAVGRYRLPVAVAPWNLVYFGIGLLVTMGMVKIIPSAEGWPFLKHPVGAYLVMKFLSGAKFYGKKPHSFFLDMVAYLLMPKRYEHFKPVTWEKIMQTGFVTPVIRKKRIATTAAERLAQTDPFFAAARARAEAAGILIRHRKEERH